MVGDDQSESMDSKRMSNSIIGKPKLADIPSGSQVQPLNNEKEDMCVLKFQAYASSQTGYAPYTDKVNQDAFSIKNYIIHDSNVDMYFVCDGHGRNGERVSQYCVQEIPELIKRYIEKKKKISSSIIKDAITEGCEMSHKQLEKSHIQIAVAGTTVVLAVIWNNTLFMANVGDSRSFQTSKKGNHAVVKLTTEDHKPETKAERERIEAHGGFVMAQKDEDGSDFGPSRVWNQEMTAPGQAMSRSVGDGLAHSLGVSAKPDLSHSLYSGPLINFKILISKKSDLSQKRKPYFKSFLYRLYILIALYCTKSIQIILIKNFLFLIFVQYFHLFINYIE